MGYQGWSQGPELFYRVLALDRCHSQEELLAVSIWRPNLCGTSSYQVSHRLEGNKSRERQHKQRGISCWWAWGKVGNCWNWLFDWSQLYKVLYEELSGYSEVSGWRRWSFYSLNSSRLMGYSNLTLLTLLEQSSMIHSLFTRLLIRGGIEMSSQSVAAKECCC